MQNSSAATNHSSDETCLRGVRLCKQQHLPESVQRLRTSASVGAGLKADRLLSDRMGGKQAFGLAGRSVTHVLHPFTQPGNFGAQRG